jgi:flavoprotein
MQYGNLSPSAYSQLKIQIVSVETENKEKLEELNKKLVILHPHSILNLIIRLQQ